MKVDGYPLWLLQSLQRCCCAGPPAASPAAGVTDLTHTAAASALPGPPGQNWLLPLPPPAHRCRQPFTALMSVCVAHHPAALPAAVHESTSHKANMSDDL